MIGFVSRGHHGHADGARPGAIRGTGGSGRQFVSISLVRELGPLLTALLVAGRNSSGIASEIGSMKVTEQIDAMRALGTDPIQKLVTPPAYRHRRSCCPCSPSLRLHRPDRRLGDRLLFPRRAESTVLVHCVARTGVE
jgi:hypothetical protein